MMSPEQLLHFRGLIDCRTVVDLCVDHLYRCIMGGGQPLHEGVGSRLRPSRNPLTASTNIEVRSRNLQAPNMRLRRSQAMALFVIDSPDLNPRAISTGVSLILSGVGEEGFMHSCRGAWPVPRLLRLATRTNRRVRALPHHSSSRYWGGVTFLDDEILLPRSRVREWS